MERSKPKASQVPIYVWPILWVLAFVFSFALIHQVTGWPFLNGEWAGIGAVLFLGLMTFYSAVIASGLCAVVAVVVVVLRLRADRQRRELGVRSDHEGPRAWDRPRAGSGESARRPGDDAAEV